jgi:cyclopropane fatty-acyl-phospholipid synthase-like methyltransferase
VTESNDVTAAHGEHYRIVERPVLRRVERKVIGSDYGATSYTTRTQADRLAHHLDLAADMLVLDLGSGAGWPGIYLAATTGARVVLSDIPAEGLAVAARRIQQDGVASSVVAASADSLPFRDQTFDAVTSSDVLC